MIFSMLNVVDAWNQISWEDAIQQVAEPEPNGYGKDVGILIAGVITLAVLYKLWLKYGKK